MYLRRSYSLPPRLAVFLFIYLGYVLESANALEERPGCPESDFVSCVTRLRLKRVPFDKNMLTVVFNVTTEAKLKHTCMAYTDIMPCFRDRIVRCGNDKQKRLLDEVTKMVRFLCSSISKEKQAIFLKHVQCIGRLLQMPVSAECNLESRREYQKIVACRAECNSQRDFLCMLRVWVSEQSLCTLIDIEKTCGGEAAGFYEELQTNVFNEEFPIVCSSNTSSTNSGFAQTAAPQFPSTPVPTGSGGSVQVDGGITAVYARLPPSAVVTPFWEYPILMTTTAGHSNVYNPGPVQVQETTINVGHPTTPRLDLQSPPTTPATTPAVNPDASTSLWQKWLSYLMPEPTVPTPQVPVTQSATMFHIPFEVTPTIQSSRQRPVEEETTTHTAVAMETRPTVHSEVPRDPSTPGASSPAAPASVEPLTQSTWKPWYLGGVVRSGQIPMVLAPVTPSFRGHQEVQQRGRSQIPAVVSTQGLPEPINPHSTLSIQSIGSNTALPSDPKIHQLSSSNTVLPRTIPRTYPTHIHTDWTPSVPVKHERMEEKQKEELKQYDVTVVDSIFPYADPGHVTVSSGLSVKSGGVRFTCSVSVSILCVVSCLFF